MISTPASFFRFPFIVQFIEEFYIPYLDRVSGLHALADKLSFDPHLLQNVRADAAQRFFVVVEAQHQIIDRFDAVRAEVFENLRGVFKSAKDIVAIRSTLVPETFVTPRIQYVES